MELVLRPGFDKVYIWRARLRNLRTSRTLFYGPFVGLVISATVRALNKTFQKELEELPRRHKDTKAQKNYKQMIDLLHIQIAKPELCL